MNLGLQNVEPQSLPASVQVPTTDAKILWVQAFKDKNVEAWDAAVHSGMRQTRANLINIIADLAHVSHEKVELWALKVTEVHLSFCARMTTAQTNLILDSCHPFLFARPFLSAASPAVPERDVVIVWANSIRNTAELLRIVTTLDGVRGLVANKTSLGVRVHRDHVMSARKLLGSNAKILEENKNVGGNFRFILKGVPSDISASQLIKTLVTPAENSPWTKWSVIPTKHQVIGEVSNWHVKADVAPSIDRLIFPGGQKVIVVAEDSPVEVYNKTKDKKFQKNEDRKAARREAILKQHTRLYARPMAGLD